VPTLNPEAFTIVSSGRKEWKRKNNTDTNHNGRFNIRTDGVDLNRNYPIFWYDDRPQSVNSFYYKGTAPASENEIKAIIELASAQKFKLAFFYHSSVSGNLNEMIYLPWQDKKDESIRSDFRDMREIARTYASAVPRDYASGTYLVHIDNTSKLGNARNFFYYKYGTYAYDIEVCGKNNFGVGVVHPSAQMKYNIVQKNVQALLKTLVNIP
jgi:hypothetical protein